MHLWTLARAAKGIQSAFSILSRYLRCFLKGSQKGWSAHPRQSGMASNPGSGAKQPQEGPLKIEEARASLIKVRSRFDHWENMTRQYHAVVSSSVGPMPEGCTSR